MQRQLENNVTRRIEGRPQAPAPPVFPQKEIVYVIQTDRGRETLAPEKVAKRYGWKNDPSRVRLTGR